MKFVGVPGQSAGLAGGESKGGEPPLCRRGGGVHRGGTPSKGSLPYAPFWVLFRRGKSTPGYGAGGPEKLTSRRAVRSAKNKNTPLPHKETKARDLCGTTLLARERRATQVLWGNGHRRAGLVGPGRWLRPAGSAACSKGIFPRLTSPPFHRFGRLSVQAGAGYLSFSAQFTMIMIPYYTPEAGLSTVFPGIFAFPPARSRPAVRAVKGATVTRPKEPTTVWIISAATYL